MSEISKLIAEIKSEGILRAGNKLEQLYGVAEQMETDYAALQQKLDAMAAENAALKISRSILAENTLETCSVLASIGSRHEAIMRGFMASTGNGNKYPKPITTLVNEALREIETPAIGAYLNSVRAEGVDLVKSHPAISLVSLTHICEQIAAGLRSGTHDTADKEG